MLFIRFSSEEVLRRSCNQLGVDLVANKNELENTLFLENNEFFNKVFDERKNEINSKHSSGEEMKELEYMAMDEQVKNLKRWLGYDENDETKAKDQTPADQIE